MAAPDFTSLRIGQINGAGDVDAMFLQVFGGEVLTAYDTLCVMQGRQMTRNISEGISAKFPATWRVNASYHTPGTTLVGQASNVAERVISIDDLLIADVFIPNIDEAKNHWDYRSVYSAECGKALARTYDQNSLQVSVLAARASATVTGGDGGSALTDASMKTDSTVLSGALYDAAQAMDEKNVPDERFVVLKPAQFYLLAQDKAIQSTLIGGAGGYSDGKIFRIAGIELVKSNHLPTTNITTGPSAYQGDFSKTAGIVMTKDAMGTVKLLDLGVESDYQIRQQGWFTVAKMAVGHGILRPECAVELATA
jgi:hypothetical protein